jgi:hypothetical protein
MTRLGGILTSTGSFTVQSMYGPVWHNLFSASPQI